MKQTKLIAILAALLALGAWTGGAAAQVEENSLRVGAYFISYHVKADDISGPFVPPGVNLDVKNTSTLYLAGVHRLNRNFDVELAFDNPPQTETVGKGPATLGSAPFDG